MIIRWYGQSAFLLNGKHAVVIDPFGADAAAVAETMGLAFTYPPIEGLSADLLLITHEHFDHNAAEAVPGAGQVIRSTAGTFESPVGEVVMVASEHDEVAGTARGPNSILRFELDGLTFCHFGDFGQDELRAAQRQALGDADVVFLPVGGGGATIGGEVAASVADALNPRLIVAMHFRTAAINFLDPPDAFLDAVNGDVRRLPASEFDPQELLGTREHPTVLVLDPPLGR